MMRRLYVHQQPDWPGLHWQNDDLTDWLAAVRHDQGRLIARIENLGFSLRQEAAVETLTEEIVTSSGIEGEPLDPEQVRSSVARHLGADIGGLPSEDRSVEGIVELMSDATQNYAEPLDADRLFGWHATLFPNGRSGLSRITAGAWRDDSAGPMQARSGPVGRERVHFEAPAADRVAREMETFLAWFNTPSTTDGVLRAGLAHLWFVTIHPFYDGNGRIARAIADMALARSEDSPQRFYSMSAQIRQERSSYYRVLERTQRRGTTDVSEWMNWFLECFGRAINRAEVSLDGVRRKARIRERVENSSVNDRQWKVINLLLGDFQGNLTTSQWATLTKSSQDTALRDIKELIDRGVLVRPGRRAQHQLRPDRRLRTLEPIPRNHPRNLLESPGRGLRLQKGERNDGSKTLRDTRQRRDTGRP